MESPNPFMETKPPSKYEFVTWDYYSKYMESHNPFMFQTNQLWCLYIYIPIIY